MAKVVLDEIRSGFEISQHRLASEIGKLLAGAVAPHIPALLPRDKKIGPGKITITYSGEALVDDLAATDAAVRQALHKFTNASGMTDSINSLK